MKPMLIMICTTIKIEKATLLRLNNSTIDFNTNAADFMITAPSTVNLAQK